MELIKELEAAGAVLPAEAREIICLFEARLTGQIAVLTAKVVKLEGRLNINSRNSHLPPSMNRPGVIPPATNKKSGQKRGGQPGHHGNSRALAPIDLVDEIVEHKPSACRGCGGDLAGATAAGYGRIQQVDLPPIVATITEHRPMAVRCTACGTVSRGVVPDGVSHHRFGPHLSGLIASLCGAYRMSRRQTALLLGDLLHTAPSASTVQALLYETGNALGAVADELKDQIMTTSVIHADETGWKMAGQRRWLWTLTSPTWTIFHGSRHRSEAALREVLPANYQGVLVTDRYGAYNTHPKERRQLCWSHLTRDFTWLSENHLPEAVRRLGSAGLALCHEIFHHWHRLRDGRIAKATLYKRLGPIKVRLKGILQQLAELPKGKGRRFGQNLLKYWDALWTFTKVPGVEPTNNRAERAVRPSVMLRKTSFGSNSEAGLQATTRLLSVVATCRQQQRSVLDYLTGAISASRQGSQAPLLLTEG